MHSIKLRFDVHIIGQKLLYVTAYDSNYLKFISVLLIYLNQNKTHISYIASVRYDHTRKWRADYL